VAEPRIKTLELFSVAHAIPQECRFTSYEDLLNYSAQMKQETGYRLADAVRVETQHHSIKVLISAL